jgi:hypothetical protein
MPFAGMTASMALYTNVGPQSGPVLWEHHLGALGVFDEPQTGLDETELPQGIAYPVARDDDGRCLYCLEVCGRVLLCRWVVVGRVFVEAELERGLVPAAIHDRGPQEFAGVHAGQDSECMARRASSCNASAANSGTETTSSSTR